MSTVKKAMALASNLKENDIYKDMIEYTILNEKYNLDEKVEEKNFCFISPSRNLMSRGGESGFRIYLRSL